MKNRYNFVILSLINLKSPAFYSLQPVNFHIYWARDKNQPEVEKSLLKFETSNYYNLLIAYLLFITS